MEMYVCFDEYGDLLQESKTVIITSGNPIDLSLVAIANKQKINNSPTQIIVHMLERESNGNSIYSERWRNVSN